MADLQKYFEIFHDRIRTDYEKRATLKEKKDIIVERIQRHLKANDRPSFVELIQGSYKMGTGIETIADLEYDIDIGLRFGFRDDEYKAKTVRSWVIEAMEGHTDTAVDDKAPCIRVTYADGYHVDLVPYAVWEDDGAPEKYRLAHRDAGWCDSDPPGLLEHVHKARDIYKGTEDQKTKTDQFRRCVRYLKRWNDVAIPMDRRDKATGLAFTLLCRDRLAPRKSIDGADDRTALSLLARSCGQQVGRIESKKPTPQYEDMFGRLADDDMSKLKARFTKLADALDKAGAMADPREACVLLQEIFGDDFPVPEPADTAKKSSAPAIISSSSSA